MYLQHKTKFSLTVLAGCLAFAISPAFAQEEETLDPRDALAVARALGISGDDTRPDDQFRTSLFGRPLIIGGEIEGAGQWRHDYALDPDAEDDDLRLNPEAKLETTWLLSDRLVAFTKTKLSASKTVYAEDGDHEGEAGAELDEAWLLATGLFGGKFALQAGRQQYQDRREWWWNESLDSLRMHFFAGKFDAFIGVGREFGSKSTFEELAPEDKDIVRILGHATWRLNDRNQLEAYALRANDRSRRYRPDDIVNEDRIDERDARLTWVGVRARGRAKVKPIGKVYYWADAARVSGSERIFESEDLDNGTRQVTGSRRQKVRGWAVDLGASVELPFASQPYLTVSYARGSGDADADDATDRGFRQTGLQGNNGKYRGNSRFRYYGEVLRPELSNLEVKTVAFGMPIGERWWIENVYHDYRQVHASDTLAGARLRTDPIGENDEIGEEFDVIVGFEAPPRWEFELTAGAFRAGKAYGERAGDWASTVAFKLDYNF